MPRYEVILKLTFNAESQHDAAVAADELAGAMEDDALVSLYEVCPGDTSLRVQSISWPVDS